MITFLFTFEVTRSWCKPITVKKRAASVLDAKLEVIKDYPNALNIKHLSKKVINR